MSEEEGELRKPCAGNPHARFDEGAQETGCTVWRLFATPQETVDTPEAADLPTPAPYSTL